MSDTPSIIQTERLLAAVLPITVSLNQIRTVMGPGLTELKQTLAAQGIAIAGPWYTHHFKPPAETFDFEIGIPIAQPVTAAGRVRPGEWPALRMVRTVYRGPYEGLPDAWKAFRQWIKESGLRTAAELWEQYAVGPESSPDPADWKTELSQPLLD